MTLELEAWILSFQLTAQLEMEHKQNMVMLAAQMFVAGEESERRRPKAQVLTLIGVPPGLAGERGGGAVICTVTEVVKGGPYHQPLQGLSAASFWQFQADGIQNMC